MYFVVVKVASRRSSKAGPILLFGTLEHCASLEDEAMGAIQV